MDHQAPIAPWLMAKRSVIIAGHKTSVSLENAFWDALKAAASRRSMTINELVTLVDGSRHGNLSSALRVFLLKDQRGEGDLAPAPRATRHGAAIGSNS
jgi:predicted DNA-binding ribbon-helix-helix protein